MDSIRKHAFLHLLFLLPSSIAFTTPPHLTPTNAVLSTHTSLYVSKSKSPKSSSFTTKDGSPNLALDIDNESYIVTTKARNKKSGCGIPSVPPGNCQLFDPNMEAKKQNTNELYQRISLKNNYQYKENYYIMDDGVAVPKEKEPILVKETLVNVNPAKQTSVEKSDLMEAQHWLEHLDSNGALPQNFAKPNAPVLGTLLGSGRIIAADAPGDIRHVIIKCPPGLQYVEGQSISILPPGIDEKTGRAHKPRLYSIASTRYGDVNRDGSTLSLCVRRAVFYDEEGVEDPTKAGVCSNFLCDAPPGTQISLAGPVGKTMLLPKDPDTDIIMVGTGTGVAPYRGFLHRLFLENTVARHLYTGDAWMILGVPTSGGLLYHDEFESMKETANDNLRIDYAISREMKTSTGEKMYVQNVIAENAEEIFNKLDTGAVMYFCGLKGMMPPILETMERVAQDRGLDWKAMLKRLKDNHQWHVEVY